MDRYRIFRRGKIWYLENGTTGKQTSLHTRDKREAQRVLNAYGEATQNPSINLQIARAYMNVADERYAQRTWNDVLAHIIDHCEAGSEKERRWKIVAKDAAYDLIRNKPVAETQPENFIAVLNAGTVSTNVFLRRLQNYCVDMNWLILPILPKRLFPKPEHKPKRAISQIEHERIVAREANEERHNFYELLWHTGGSQGDIARLDASDSLRDIPKCFLRSSMMMVADEIGNTVFHNAVLGENLPHIPWQLWTECNCAVQNKDGDNVLHLAARFHKLKYIKNPQEVMTPKTLFAKNRWYESPLELAIQSGQLAEIPPTLSLASRVGETSQLVRAIAREAFPDASHPHHIEAKQWTIVLAKVALSPQIARDKAVA